MDNYSRDVFKKRKNKAYKNLVSYGQYGVVTALALAALATGGLAQAEEQVGTEQSTVMATSTSDSQLSVATSTESSEVLPTVSSSSESSQAVTSETVTETELTSESATLQVSDIQVSDIQVSDNQGSTSTNQTASSEASSETNLQASESDATSLIQTQEATVSSEKETVPATKASSENLPLIPISNATFSWQEVPQASSLLENGAELQASGAKIVYESQPIFGSTSAGLLVTYPDGSIATIAVPITVTANAVRKTLAAAVEEGSGTRAVATSPNTSGTVSGSLTSQSATSNLKVIDTVNQTTVLDISGDAANYSGGYLEVRITNGSSLDVTPSPLTGVTATKSYDGNDAIIKYTFSPSGLNGGAYYSLKFSYKFKPVDNWGNVVDDLNDNNFTIITTSDFYDKDGLLVKHLGTDTHSFTESKNAANIGTRMSGNQIVGYDLNKDGLVDTGASTLNFYVNTGTLLTNGSVFNDSYSAGTGIFDGRMVNGMGNTSPGATVIDAVTSYTYDVSLVPGTTLSAESIAAGWYEDATGYHLSADRANNPLVGGSTSTIDNSVNLIPLILDIVDGTSVTTLTNNKSISVTGTYTKENGTTYTNTRTTNYSVIIPTVEPSQGEIFLSHNVSGDSEIIKSYGRAYYRTEFGLTNLAQTDVPYSLTNYSLLFTTGNDNEFFYRVELDSHALASKLRAGGSLQVYDDATGTLLHTFDANNTAGFDISEALKVKTLRYEFINIDLEKDSTSTFNSSSYHTKEFTFFSDWSTIYNDSSITSLTSSTVATLQNDAGTISTSQTRSTVLERIIMNVDMVDSFPANMSFSTRTGGGFTQRYYVTNTKTGNTQTFGETQTAAYPGELYQAYLVDPELKINASNNQQYLQVIYNWNNTGKDLYYETLPVTTTSDPISQNGVSIANNFVPNGTYEVLTIGYWAEVDPGFVPTDGIDLTAPINGITITTANSTTRTFTVTLNASESSGVISQVKPDAASGYGFNTNNNEAKNIVDFKVTYENVSPQELSDVTVITSLPRTGDKQLDAATKNRNSQFSVYLTEAVTPPAGWEAVYTTVAGTSVQMEAGTWLTADQVTDWSTITAVKFVATGPVAPSSGVDFYISNAVIGGDALQGEKAYLSSASSVGTAAYIESNNVLIEMAREIADGTVTVKYVNEAGEVIATEKVLKNDIKSDYDASNQATYYPTNITGTDGLPYVYVETDPTSAPNKGTYSETPQVITHVYKLVPQTATFTYKDVTDAANPVQLGAVDSETGGSGQDIAYDTATRINDYLKQGYELVSNNYTDTTIYDTDATVDQPFTIELRQRVVDIPKNAVPGEPVDPIDPNSPLWPDTVGTLETELVQSRAIEYRYLTVTGEVAADPVVQTVIFTRTATVNLVTGEIVYGEWTSEDPIYEEVVSPTIPGYTANIPVVSEVTGEPGVEIGIARIVYTPNEQVGTVTYIDETTGATLEVENLKGVTAAAIGYTTADRIAYYESLGYELVSDNYPADAVYDNIDGNSQDYQVVLKHIIEPVTPDTVDPDTNAPVELSRTVTRTIEYKYIDENGAEASATVTQTATFTRTATVDMVIGEVVYADWTSADAELDAVDSPVIAGYTANVLNVPTLTVDADSTNSNVLVIYTPNEQVATVTYIDETTGQELEVADLTGVTDAAIGYTTADRIAYYESLGYELVSDNYPADAVYDNIDGNSQDYVVVLRHKIEPVTPDTVDPETNAPVELSRTVTRTIEYKYIDENGAEASATVTQTATFTRTATVDKVTGKVTYTEWTSADAELDRVDSPAIQGYTPNMTNVPALTVNADTKDQSVVVIYTPDVQKASVTYTDETTGATLEITNLTGETDAAIGYTTADRIAYYESIGYELVSDNYLTDAVYDKDGNVTQEFQVVLKHIVTPVTPADPTNPKDGSTLELSRTVTRTIEYKYFTENGEEASATVTQTVTFTRTATVDMVTGQVTYAAWETESADLAQVDSPAIEGYTPNLSSIPAMTVDPNQSDIHTVVIYNADQQKARVTYYDQTSGRVLETSDLTGLSDEAIDYTTTDRIAYYESIGYRLVSNDYPDAPVYDKDGNVLQEFQVVLEHIVTPVTPENPVNPKTNQELELTRTVTRTIEYKYLTETGQEASATVTQSTTFTRTATVDMVTGQVVYSDWTSENPILDAVTSPEIPGYTANQLVVGSVQVTANQSSLNTIVVYTPDVQKATVDFIDETSGTTLHTENLTGVSDETIGYSTEEKIAYYESIGYELVTDGYPADSVYDKDGNVDQNFTVTLRQKQVPVDPTNPTNPKDGSTLELTRTVTRTIEYKYIDENGQEASATVIQTATFTRTATVNMVTGEVTYGDWASEDAELDAVDSPVIDGYTPNMANVPALTVDTATEDQSVVVIYTPDTQKATISYVDETTGETITVDEVTGGSDSPIGYTTTDRIKALEEQGYELVTDGYPTDSVYDKDGNVDQNFTVTLRQKQVPVDPTNPTNPKDGSTLELTQTVTRTIEYKYIDENGQEASATVTQTATFTRTATVNMVTGEVTYGDWTSEDAELEAVDSPVINGYTANLANVPALTVDADTENQTVVVIYTPDTQKATISYVDETTGETITVDEVTGDTDSPIGYTTSDRIKALEEQGYELVTDGYPTDSVYDKDGNVDQNFTVTLRQKQVPVDPANPTNPKDGSTLELTRTVTRTIQYKYIDENGQEASATVTQTATFTRTATVNMVTGEVIYGGWTSEDAELDAVVSPAIDGYTPNLANVPALTVDAATEDQSVVVIYTPDTQKATISYVDETTGQVITVDEVSGDSDSPIGYTTSDRIKALEEQGYELVTDGYPTDSVYDKDGNVDQNFTVTLRQKVVPITPENPTNPKDGSTLELTRTVTRTIQYKYIDENGQEASATVTQTATFTRTATVNMVTGEVVYTDWTSVDAELDAVVSPAIDGYTPNMANVPALTVDAATEDQSVVVIYTPDTQKATITYIDATTGETITVDEVTGDTDSPIGYTTSDRIKALEEQGYELVTDGYPTDSVYDKDGNVDQNFTVTLRQKQVPVDPTDPTNPKDGSTLELTRTVTRTIEYKYIDENGQEASATVTQTATFTRTATVNMVTGEVTYGEWTSEDAELDAVDSPVIDGYTPNLANVPALTVDAATEDQSVVVIYTPDTQKATITYIDETTGETITVDEVTGDTDSPIGYTTEDRIKALEEQGYELVTDGYPTDSVYDKDVNVDQNFTVTLRQKQVPVDPTNPTNPKDGSTLELTRTVTRTIEYKYIDENGQEASATVTQTATFTRTATVNMVTGEVTYGDWTSEDAELDAVVSPAIDGYTPNLANVPALTVDADTENQTVVIIYTPQVAPTPDPEPNPEPLPTVPDNPVKPTNPVDPEEPVTPNLPHQTQTNSFVIQTEARTEILSEGVTTLPETGEESQIWMAILGIIMMSMGIMIFKKKENDQD
ncbi:mucin-binding protein [Streptococcus pluranimalium]